VPPKLAVSAGTPIGGHSRPCGHAVTDHNIDIDVDISGSGQLSADFFTVVPQQRACRQFSGEPVDDATVSAVLTAACWAPSSENRQPWRFVVVRSAAARGTLGTLMKELWEAGGRRYTEGRVSPELLRDVDIGLAGGGIAAAPVLVVVGGDSTAVDRAYLKSSVFPAVQNMLLAATAIGLGSCLTTIATMRADDVRAVVGFPPEIDPMAVVPLGYPARPLGRPRRDPVESKTSRERYGTAWR
jgi:F420 biosynthesis protein FbiB-like protein